MASPGLAGRFTPIALCLGTRGNGPFRRAGRGWRPHRLAPAPRQHAVDDRRKVEVGHPGNAGNGEEAGGRRVRLVPPDRASGSTGRAGATGRLGAMATGQAGACRPRASSRSTASGGRAGPVRKAAPRTVAAEVDGALLQRSARDARARLFGGRLRNASKHNIALASDLPNPGFVAPVGWRPPYAARSHDALQPATMTAGPAPSRGNRMPARRASNISRRADPHPSPWVLWPIMARVHRRDRATTIGGKRGRSALIRKFRGSPGIPSTCTRMRPFGAG